MRNHSQVVCGKETPLHTTPKRGDRSQDVSTQGPTITPQTCAVLRMLFDAQHEDDSFRAATAVDQLTFIVELERLSGIAR